MFTYNNYTLYFYDLNVSTCFQFSEGDAYVYTVFEKYRNTVPEDYLT